MTVELIDPAGPTRESGFQRLGTICGENEEHIGALTQTVEFVQKPVQHHLVARAASLGPIASDQVGVLDDNQRRLEETRERHVLREYAHFLGGNE